MTVVQYNRLSAGFTNRSGRILLKWSNLICAGLFYLCYPVALAILWVRQDVRLTKVILIPAISFVILSGFRKWFNRPRPYEDFGIPPLLKKESKGASFPSRHVFSAFMIAATLGTLTPWCYLLYVPAILLALIRVIGGVHYPLDVIVGARFAVICSLFFLI